MGHLREFVYHLERERDRFKDEEESFTDFVQNLDTECALLDVLASTTEFEEGFEETSMGFAVVTAQNKRWSRGENAPITCDQCSRAIETSEVKRCSKCKFSWYCGANCQRRAWRAHKVDCFEAVATPALGEEGNRTEVIGQVSRES